MKCFFAVLPLYLLTMLSVPILAEETSPGTLTVTASRSDHSVADMAQTTWIIEQSEIEQQFQGGKELKEVLAQLIPGMDVSSQGRTNYGMNMRGRKMLVMVDGVRLNSSRSDSRQLDAIDPFNIARIEVISGATSLYGGGSTGGLINIVTKKGQPETEVELQTGVKSGFSRYNDHDENIAAAVSGGSHNAFARLSLAYQRFGGWYDGHGNEVIIDNTQTGLQYSDRLDIMGTATLNISATKQLQLISQYYKSQSDGKHGLFLGDNFSAVTANGRAYNKNHLDSDRIPGTARHLINLQYTDSAFFGQDLLTQIYYRDESLTFYPFPTLSKGGVTSIGASRQNTQFYGAKLTVNSKPTDRLNLTWGIDVDHETFNANQQFFDLATAAASGGMTLHNAYNVGRYPGYSISNIGPFLQAAWNIDAITLSGGVRYQYSGNRVDDFVGYAQQQAIAMGKARSAAAVPGGNTAYNNLLFNAGILGHLTERQQLWLNFSQGFEIPDLAKYYGSGNYTLIGDHYRLNNSVNVNESRLKGVKVSAYELGWRLIGDNLRTQLAAYYSLSDKTIGINKKDMTIVINDDKRRISGAEGQIDYFFTGNDLSIGSNFNVIISQTHHKNTWQKLTIDSASTSKISAWVDWTPGDGSLRLQASQSFPLSDAAGKKIDGYHTVDILGSYRLPEGQISVSIENVLNEDYVTVWGQRAPGLYSPTYGAARLYTYKGRGRTATLMYSVLF